MFMQRNFSQQGYYHIYNRGALKQTLFHDQKDYARFLFLLLAQQGNNTFLKITRLLGKHRMLDIQQTLEEKVDDIARERQVEVINFCIMPNHFHVTLHELQDGGISRYMQKILNGYGKYFNKKYEKSGHVFQGAYKCKHVIDDQQIFYLSAYIHKNPNELSKWKNNIVNYPWSSYQDYIQKNRWGSLISSDIILDAHPSAKEYEKFVQSTSAKEEL